MLKEYHPSISYQTRGQLLGSWISQCNVEEEWSDILLLLLPLSGCAVSTDGYWNDSLAEHWLCCCTRRTELVKFGLAVMQ